MSTIIKLKVMNNHSDYFMADIIMAFKFDKLVKTALDGSLI